MFLLATPIDSGGVYSWVYNRSLYNLKGNDYVGNMEYSSAVNTAGTKTHTLLRVHNPEGYSDNFNNSFMSTYFYYFRCDHLGNIREVWWALFIVYAYGNRSDPIVLCNVPSIIPAECHGQVMRLIILPFNHINTTTRSL